MKNHLRLALAAALLFQAPQVLAESYSAIDPSESDVTAPAPNAPAAVAPQTAALAESHVQPVRQTLYYYSTARLTSLRGANAGSVSTQNVLLKKSLDPESGTISEIACYADPEKPASVESVYMKVEGGKISVISDNPDFVPSSNLSGTGSLSGNAWSWNYLKFSMRAGPAIIEDSNFVVNRHDSRGNPNGLLIGRKQIFGNDGTPIQLYELEMNQVSVDQYNYYSSQMKCPF